MTTDKDPDFKGIVERLSNEKLPDTKLLAGGWWDTNTYARKHYASCMEARLRSDWETIRLLRTLEHGEKCGHELPFSPPLECTCGLSAHLSKLLEPFTP